MRGAQAKLIHRPNADFLAGHNPRSEVRSDLHEHAIGFRQPRNLAPNQIPGDALFVVHPVRGFAERRGMRRRSASKSGRMIPVGASDLRLLARGSRPRHWWLPRYLNWRAMRKRSTAGCWTKAPDFRTPYPAFCLCRPGSPGAAREPRRKNGISSRRGGLPVVAHAQNSFDFVKLV